MQINLISEDFLHEGRLKQIGKAIKSAYNNDNPNTYDNTVATAGAGMGVAAAATGGMGPEVPLTGMGIGAGGIIAKGVSTISGTLRRLKRARAMKASIDNSNQA